MQKKSFIKDNFGWPVALIIIGFFMIGVSSYAIKIGRKLR